MSVCAIMLVKDEADIIETTVRHLFTQVDEVLVADNGSTDGTSEILHGLIGEGPLILTADEEVGYYQSQKMTEYAREATRLGHEWVLPCDADEIWYSDFGRVGDLLAIWPVDIAEASLYDHVATRQDPAQLTDPTERLAWHRWEKGRLPKVAARTRPGLVIEQGNHGAHYPGPVTRMHDALVIRHFPYRSKEQMVTKVRNGAAAYAATDLPDDMGQHWRDYGRLLDAGGEEAIHELFDTWFLATLPDTTLIYDPAPVKR